jgi:putative transposase
MPFRVCYYHVVWATKGRSPLITPRVEKVIFAAIRRKSTELKSPILAINSAADHVHIAVSISTTVAVSEWVRQVKGVSTYEVNTTFSLSEHFRWQRGYGVLTFGKRQLEFVAEYIKNQKTHHRYNEVINYLERLEE